MPKKTNAKAAKAAVVTVDLNEEYCMITDILEFEKIPFNRLRVLKLVEAGLTFEKFSFWLVDEFDRYYPWKHTMAAFNMLEVWAQNELAAARKKRAGK